MRKVKFITFFFKQMSNQELLDASKKGDLESVRRLLENRQIEINCKDI